METRARLLNAASDVFVARGFRHTRVDDLCSTAGYTRGAFYSQFDNVEEVFFILYEQWATETVEKLRGTMQHIEPLADLSGTVEKIVDTLLFDRNWLHIKTDFLMHAARNPDVGHRLELHRAQLQAAIQEPLAASGLEPFRSTDSAATAVRAIITAYDGVGIQLLLDGNLRAARSWLIQLIAAVLTHAPGSAKDPQ